MTEERIVDGTGSYCLEPWTATAGRTRRGESENFFSLERRGGERDGIGSDGAWGEMGACDVCVRVWRQFFRRWVVGACAGFSFHAMKGKDEGRCGD